MANTKLSAKRRLKMDTHIRRLLIIMVCWFVFMGIMKGRKFYSVVNFPMFQASFHPMVILRGSAARRLIRGCRICSWLP